jgi:uncharacterized MnhB-related membrane protein
MLCQCILPLLSIGAHTLHFSPEILYLVVSDSYLSLLLCLVYLEKILDIDDK